MLIRTYCRSAVRQIARSRFHSFLNIFGLSIGIAFFLLIAAFSWSEWRVNRGLRNADRQYFLESNWRDPSMGPTITTLGPLARALKENYPSLVANYYRWDGIDCNVSYGDKHFKEGIQLGDSTLLHMYGFRLLRGDARTALTDPFTVVITASKAVKFFGRTDVVGRSLTIANFSGGRQDFRITGVMEDPSGNSVTHLNDANNNGIYLPGINLPFFGRNMDWPNIYIVSYIELQKGVRPEDLAGPISHLIKVNEPASVFANLKVQPRPLEEYYLTGSVRKMLFTIGCVAAFILLMAVINFVNLAVSRSASRMREIGVRKVLGGLRRQLILQFLTESILLALLATASALLLYMAFTPLLASMLGKDVPLLTALPAVARIAIPAFALLLGTLAGLYPAFVLSALPSIDSLKGKTGAMRQHVFLRKGLVGFQFAVAMVALVGAVIISRQIRLFFSDQLGYDKEYVVSARLPRDWSPRGVQQMELVRADFAGMPGVENAAISYEVPDGGNGNSQGIYREGGDSTRAVVAQQMSADEHYAATYRIPMAAGDFFNSPGGSSVNDTFRVVINETAARALGWRQPREAVNRRIRINGALPVFTVAGVVKDFHFDAMGTPITPEIFLHLSLSNVYRYISFKLRPGNIGVTLADLQRQWSRLVPGVAFDYKFMDETLATVYNSELRLQKAANTAAALSLIIVLPGVIGLLSLSVQKRTKEIAIRKVIGAGVAGIIRLFLREYLPVLLIGAVVASPLAWALLQRWLNDYATRITITPWPFIEAAGSLASIMVTLIAAQTISAASANPVKALRSE